MINNVVLLGNLAGNPEIKTSKTGNQFCAFCIAINNTVKGERTVTYFDCIAGGEAGISIERYFRQGDYICVNGSLCQRKYKTKHGDCAKSCYINVNSFSFCGSSYNESAMQEYDDEPQVDLPSSEDDLPY